MLAMNIPVPPQLEQAVGYPGDAPQWWAVYWEPCGDEAMYDDGRCSGTGCWTGYLAWVRHPAVALELARALGPDGHLGSGDAEATHWLVIDRQARSAFLAPVREARRVLHEQWPAEEPVALGEADWHALLARLDEEFRSRPMPTNEEIEARMVEQRRLEEEMVSWLDATPQAREAQEIIRRMTGGGNQPPG
jgi:hypothetical protein